MEDRDYDFKFSVVMAVYNTQDYLNEAIDSLISQTIGFLENIQLVLVDDGSEDGSADICIEYQSRYPDNIVFISQENGGPSRARNNGLQYAKGKYVNFMDSDDRFDLDAFEKVYDFFEVHFQETDVVAVPIFFFGRKNEPHVSNEKFAGSRVIDLLKEPDNIQINTASAFIKNECFRDFEFPENVSFSEDVILVNKILLERKTLGVVDGTGYNYRKRFDESSIIDTAQSRKDYNERLRNYFLYLIEYAKEREGEVPVYFQHMLAYDLQWVFEQTDLPVLTDDERDDFFKYLREILDSISAEAILNNRHLKNPIRKAYFLYMKEDDLHIELNERGHVLLKANDHVLDNIYDHIIWFDIIEFDKGFLNISGLFNSLFDVKNVSIEALREKENGAIDYYPGEYVRYTSREDVKYLGETFQFKHNFDIKVPIEEGETSKIRIRVNYHMDANNRNFSPDNIVSNFIGLNFTPHAKLSKISNYSFNDSNMVYFENNAFHLIPYSFSNLMKREWDCLKNIHGSGKQGYHQAILLRIVHLLTFPFFSIWKRNREIYLFEDRVDAGDDNAEHLFRYAIKQDDGIRKYFVLSKDSDSFEKLSKIGNVLAHSSFKHRLFIFHADKIISSHPYESALNPFFDTADDQRDFYAGLINYKICFVQHGVNLGNISPWLSKYDKNLSFITTVSPLERDAYLEEGYNYEESIVQVLGLPRYDNLKSEENRQILLIPSWRRYLRGDRDMFLNSSYFMNLNSLLNNKELIGKIKDAGYSIVFKPHPELEKSIDDGSGERYIDLLDIPEDIVVAGDESYQELLNGSSLMITDYSSVFFDFAYLKKPIIYYQKEKDFQYQGYFDMETMGYGDIIDNEDALVRKVEFYQNNGCKMEDEYLERVDAFFKYNDRNNCKRVYDCIREH